MHCPNTKSLFARIVFLRISGFAICILYLNMHDNQKVLSAYFCQNKVVADFLNLLDINPHKEPISHHSHGEI